MPGWLILADDLTGANDSGVAFARRGLDTLTATVPGAMPPAAVWVISSASRAMPPSQAAERVRGVLRDVLAGLPPDQVPKIYKKIDSALRGNPAEELLAVLQAIGARRVLIAPALPVQGRTVQAGQVFWRGVPLAQTEFQDQIRTDNLFDLFQPAAMLASLRVLGIDTVQQGAAACVEAMWRYPDGVWIADALRDTDMDALAQAAQEAQIQVLCGSAGLANAVARAVPHTGRVPAWPQPGSHPGILVAGSRSRVAAGQIEVVLRQGGCSLELPDAFLVNGEPGCLDALMAQVAQDGIHPIVLSLHALPDDPARADMLIARLGAAAAELSRRYRPAGLVLTGGDTAGAVCAALQARLIQLEGETEPGIVWGRLVDGDVPGLIVVTKAGSFGGPDSLARALAFLSA